MKIIYTKKKEEIWVDDEDYEEMNKHLWHCDKDKYARRNSKTSENRGNVTVSMHREIMNPPKEMVVDHRNHKTFDNRKENLRICTHKENQWNKKVCIKNTSGVVGVYWYKKNIHLGYFHDLDDAIKARREAEIKYYGEFQNKNFEENKENLKKSYMKDTSKMIIIDYKPRANTISGVNGVTWHKQSTSWMSYIRVDSKLINLGCYENLDSAIEARQNAEIKYYGRLAKVRDIEQC